MIKKIIVQWLGYFQVLAAGICFSFLGVFGKLSYSNEISIGELLTWRFLIAAVILWLYALIFDRNKIKISLRQFITSALLGLLGYAVFSTMYFESIKGVSISLAAMLLFTFPLFVNLGSYLFLKEKQTHKQWLSLAIACIGLVSLLWGDIFVNNKISVIMGIGAGLTYSIYVLASGQFQKNIHPISSSLYVISFAAFGLATYHQPDLPRILNFNLIQLQIVIGIAIICTIAPLSLFLAGLQKMKSSQASIVVMVEPVSAAFLGWLVLGESFALQQWVGSTLILFSIYLNNIEQQKHDL